MGNPYTPDTPNPLYDRDKLYALYYGEWLSTHEIAEMYDVTSGTVKFHLQSHNIPKKPLANISEERWIAQRRGLGNRNKLYELYYDEWLSQDEIATHYDVSLTTVQEMMSKYNIPTKPGSNISEKQWVAQRRGVEHSHADGAAPWCDPDVLRELYHVKGLSQSEIAQRLGVSQTCIEYRMNYHSISTQTSRENEKISPPYNQPYHDPEYLRVAYHIRGQTTTEIASVLGVARGTIYKWMNKHDIPRESKRMPGTFEWGSE